MGELTNATSPENVPSLPDLWMERIFCRMENRYGAKWPDSFGGIDRNRMRQAWGEELADYAGDEIKRGLGSCLARHPVWPPTVGEFMALCRPPVDAKAEFAEAREQMAERMRGAGGDVWGRPQVYWAAVAIGNYDLQTFGWDALRQRWEQALARAKSDPIPEWLAPQAALPKPGEQTVTRDEAITRMGSIRARFGGPGGGHPGSGQRILAEPGNGWARELLRKEAAGEYVAFVAQGAWRSALGYDEAITPQAALARLENRAAA